MPKVTSKYQVTIPVNVRKELGIAPGIEADFIREGDKYVLIVNQIHHVKKKWQGIYKNKISSNEYLDQVRGKIT